MMHKSKAIVLTGEILHTSDAKTAHGLIRGTERFEIIAVVDSIHAGKDAGEVLDGKKRNIPIYHSVADALNKIEKIEYCIIGIATVGGVLPAQFLAPIKECITHNISIVNGLHEYLSDVPELKKMAEEYQVELIDVRKPKRKKDLHFWTGEIFSVQAKIIAVLGTDCALGKRTTCRMIAQSCAKSGILAQMIYTGQTGWMQGGKYGFIFDSTLNDFISGEIEHAILTCWNETHPDIILIEGQSALRNPSGPCGAEFLISGNAKHVVLVHAPKRTYYEHTKTWGTIHDVQSEIDLIKMYGAEVIAIAINTEDCTDEEAAEFQKEYEGKFHLPVLLPLQQGVEKIVPIFQNLHSVK